MHTSTEIPSAGAAPASDDAPLEIARRLLARTPLIDGHNDLPWAIRENTLAPGDLDAYGLRAGAPGHTDLERLRQGRVGAQFWAIYVSCDEQAEGAARMALEQLDVARRITQESEGVLEPAVTAADVRRIFADGRIASLLGMEGGHALENSLGALRTFREMGVRYLTLTHNCHADWVDAGNLTPRHGGLTAFGREVIREMNRLGMMVDLSHTSTAVMNQVLDLSDAPVVWTHTGARALVDHSRNVPDEVLSRVPDNRGIVMITFVPSFMSAEHLDWNRREKAERKSLESMHGAKSEAARRALDAWREANPAPRATLAQVADHVDHIKRLVGADHVGIGSDFDGIEHVVEGLEDVSTFPALFAELVRRGWSDADLAKLAGENILRVMEETEEVGARLQRDRRPSIATIAELDSRG
jgi:membrane dipeptidase